MAVEKRKEDAKIVKIVLKGVLSVKKTNFIWMMKIKIHQITSREDPLVCRIIKYKRTKVMEINKIREVRLKINQDSNLVLLFLEAWVKIDNREHMKSLHIRGMPLCF
jgi:hypothetical protein